MVRRSDDIHNPCEAPLTLTAAAAATVFVEIGRLVNVRKLSSHVPNNY